MSGEYCGVDPGRMDKAAAALEHLRDVLTANVPTIVSTMNAYNAPISLGLLTTAKSRSVQDAADMRARSNLAQKLLQQDQRNHADSSQIQIQWDGPSVEAASAKVDAQLLAQAEKHPHSAQAVADLQAVADDISDHLALPKNGGADFLSAFYNEAGPQVAALAEVLHDLNGSANEHMSDELKHVFTPQDLKILRSFGSGLAYVDSHGGLSAKTIEQLTATPTLWSVSMLIKYGPSGSAYSNVDKNDKSQNFLARLTQATYHAYQNDGLQIPLGSAGPVLHYQGIEQDLASYDPLSALLQADGQNKTAAMEVLSGSDGGKLVTLLINGPGGWYSLPVSNPPSKIITLRSRGPVLPSRAVLSVPADPFSQTAIAKFFDGATSAQRGTSPQAFQSATSAYNIISNTPSPITPDGIHGVSAPVRHALVETFARYLPDMAASSYTDASLSPVHPATPSGIYVVGVSQSALSNVMQQISLSKLDFGQMQAMCKLAVGTSVGATARHQAIPGLDSPVRPFASLYARGSTEAAKVGIAKGTQEDLEHQAWNAWIAAGIGGFGNVSGPESDIFGAAQVLSALAGPVIPQFSTDNAAKAKAAALTDQNRDEFMVEVPLVQGLLSIGALPSPPPPDAFTAQGYPTAHFGDWYRDVGSDELVGGKSLDDWRAEIQNQMMVRHS